MDKRVDFSRISQCEKVVYCHPKGFFVSVEKMSEEELENYIKDAIIPKKRKISYFLDFFLKIMTQVLGNKHYNSCDLFLSISFLSYESG